MSKREIVLAVIVAVSLVGLVAKYWVLDPAIAAFDELEQEAEEIENELRIARTLVDSELKIRQRWSGYEKAGLSRTLEQADAETGGALFAWAEAAGFKKINLSDGRSRQEDELPFAELSYTLQTSGSLKQVCDLLWSIRQSPFPLKVEKSVIDLRNGESQKLQVSLTVSTLYTPGGDDD